MLGPDRPRLTSKPLAVSQLAGGQSPASDSPPTAQQLEAVRQFVTRVGGIENARSALEVLAILSDVGQSQPKSAH